MEKKLLVGDDGVLLQQLCAKEGITVHVQQELLQKAMNCHCNSGCGGTGGACGGRCGSAENWDNE